VTVPGVHILVVLETDMGLNGLWNLTQVITEKYKQKTTNA
jgi:hypothetical protein